MRNLITDTYTICKHSRLLRFMTALIIYSIIVYNALPTVGVGIGAFSIFPAGVAGLLYGSRIGGIAGLLIAFYNSFFLFRLQLTAEEIAFNSSGAGYIAVTVVGYVVGLFNEMRLHLKREIAERVQIETALAHANEQLSGEAQRAAHARALFLGAISHELRTPMNAVVGMTELILSTPLDQEQLEYAELTKINGQATLEIIDNILDFTKIESGALQLDLAPLDIVACIDEVLDRVSPQSSTKRIELFYSIDPHVPLGLIGDMVRLQQVILNLVNNAIKFTEVGEVQIIVNYQAISSVEDGSHMLRICVKDSGIGIQPADLEPIFQPFTQVDFSTTREYGGTGLGLTICHSLCTKMGGKIWAESELDVGSAFTFTIPAASSPLEWAEIEQANKFASKHALILDQNQSTRAAISNLLIRTQIQTTIVQKLDDIVLQKKPFDLLIISVEAGPLSELEQAMDIRARLNSMQNSAEGNIWSVPMIILVPSNDAPYKTYLAESKRFAKNDTIISRPIQWRKLLQYMIKSLNAIEDSGTTQVTSLTDTQLAQIHPLKILLAEDNRVNQKVAKRILQRLGYQVDIVDTGLQAFEQVSMQQERSDPYDLILMDIQMPVMDGAEATTRIRDLGPAIPQPYIIALTANVLWEDQAYYTSSGMNDYVGKPIVIKKMSQALTKASRMLRCETG